MVPQELPLLEASSPSLRSKAATIVESPEMFRNLSILESQNIEFAIKAKDLQSNELRGTINSDEPQLTILIKKHYISKIEFYRSQNNNKWKHWPNKTKALLQILLTQTKKRRNFKKRQHRNDRKVERDAKRALDTGSVVVLVNEDIPAGALALLGKELGYIPTPTRDNIDLRLDMKLVTNKILNYSNRVLSGETGIPNISNLPAKLRRKNYSTAKPSNEQAVNTAVDTMRRELDIKLKTAGSPLKPTNLSFSEIKGLKWLEQRIKDGTIAITKANKQRTLEKLENQELYEKLDCDPTQQLYEKLFKHWVQGKEEGMILARDAKEVMGVSDNTRADQTGPTNRPSTLPHYRPGQPYFYPAFKIHKLKKEKLIPGAKPPARLITALHEGASRRPDVFLADKHLRQLERDFCKDLLIDNRDALVWLDNINNTLDTELKSNIKAYFITKLYMIH